jgi:putative copper resistance protein D
MTTFMLWVHLMSVAIIIGGLGFLLLVLRPSLGVLSTEQRQTLSKAVAARFRWVGWAVITLLLISGLYNVKRYYWEEAWGKSWLLLTLKITLAFTLFAIVLGLTIPLKALDRFRVRQRTWLIVAFAVGAVVILISAYLRVG